MPKKVEQYKKLQKNKQGKNKYTAEYKLNNRVCEIKSVNRHSMISDGAVSS